MRLGYRWFAALSVLVCCALAWAPAQAEAEEAKAFEPYEAWFVLKMGGQRAGYMHSTLKRVGDEIVSTTDMTLAIKRGEVTIQIEQSGRFVETLDHRPISAESSMNLATMATTQIIDYTGETWSVTSKNAGQSTTIEIDPPAAAWLTPGELSTTIEAAIARGDETIEVTTIDPSAGTTPITIKMTRKGDDNIEVFGKIIPATRWVTETSATPGVAIEQWTDASGQAVKESFALMPGMEVEMLLADKRLALADFDAPEMLAASLIEPDKPIRNPRRLKRGVFDLVAENLKENLGNTIPNAGYQRTEWIDADTLRVTVDLDRPTWPERFEVDDETLSASSMLNHEDEAIQSLTSQAVDLQMLNAQSNKPTLSPLYKAERDAAEKLRLFVRGHIERKDLSVGFASASETARTQQGDCTEHACLLAAMLRGAGIPSRTVTGLVYADQFAGREGVFGFHMWTQAWLTDDQNKPRWVDLDAAAPGQINGFDATHLALSTSTMADDSGFNDMVPLLPLMQGMQIKVIELAWSDD